MLWRRLQCLEKVSVDTLINSILTTSTGTVHISAKARLISADMWRISMNECPLTTSHIHFPYPLPISPNSDESGKQSLYPDSDSD